MEHLLTLDSRATREQVGGKGANLARLIESGFRVPEARAVSVAAFDAHLEACRQAGAAGDRALHDAIVARPVDPALAAAMRAFVDEVGGRVSVRSSATLEDAHTHAFAGQFTTVLNVGPDGVEDAVRRVWASAFTEHVAAYLERGGLDAGALRMAVVLQHQIDSQSSGVVLGDASRAMIETVFGQGEAVVSAELETDHWDLQNGRVVATRIARKGWRVGIPEGPPTGALARFDLPEPMRERPSLSDDQVLQVARLAGRLSRSFDERPQDCEFSFVGDELYVLQTRDVTASLPIEPPPMEDWEPPGEGTWELDVSHFVRPVTRLFADRFPPAIVAGFRRSCARYGTLISHLEVRTANRFAYSHVRPADESELGTRFETAEAVWKNREWRRQAAEWEDDKRAAIERHLALQRVDLTALDDAALADHLRAVDDHVGRMIEQHHTYNMPALIPTGDLLAHVARWTDGRVSHAEVLALLAGASSVSADLRSPDARRLARAIAESDAARRLLGLDEPDDAPGASPGDLEAAQALEALCALDEDAGRHARAFLEHREYRLSEGLDPSAPTLREMPALLWRAVRDCARAADDADRAEPGEPASLARVRDAIPGEHREAFDGLLEEARATYHLRDERALYSDVWAWGILRSVCLEVGARLLRRREPLLVEPADALQASVEELVSLLLEGRGPSVLELRRRGAFQRAYTTDDAPAMLGPAPDPPPPLDALPPAVGRLMAAVMTVIGVTLAGRGEKPPSDAPVLKGHAAAGGVYEGPAHVIASPRDVETMPHGAVLVVGAGSSAFTMLAPLASAVIAEGGGLLSHVAIVCREYRIPCVVGCTGALDRVKTGRRVRVDGTHGTVTVVDDV